MGLQEAIRFSHLDAMHRKMQNKLHCLRYVGFFSSEDAVERGMRLIVGKEGFLRFYWLVDEEDGVIADAKFQAFGPLMLIILAEAACELVLRKNYDQASRLSGDLLEKHLKDRQEILPFLQEPRYLLDQLLRAINRAVELCSDIPYVSSDYFMTPIQRASRESIEEVFGWKDLPQEQKLQILEEVIEKEIQPYIQLDAGGVKVLKVNEKDQVEIMYQGSCTTCYSATGSTLSAIQQILRDKIHPNICVISKIER